MMKTRTVFIAFLLIACGAFAQDLKLLPKPKQVERRDGQFVITTNTRISFADAVDRLAAETVADEIESATGHRPQMARGKASSGIVLQRGPKGDNERFDEEGYTLDVNATRIVVTAPTAAGVFYGAQTLRQLLVPEGKRLACPALAIKDWPTMQWRGVHDDLSRGPIPTLAYMKQQIRTLAEYKINLFSLYMEHVFDYQSQPLVAPKEGALTAAEIRELVAYAQKYHVTIVPEQQAFGHLHHMLKYEQYADVAETPHGHVLTPTKERSYELIRSMYAELTPLFPGPLFHIGADETFELGRGQTRALADKEGLGKVYLEHLKRVAEIMRPYHKRLMFWGDIAMRYPELLNILPKDVIAVAWAYDPRANFDEMLQPYKQAGLDLFVAPGANNWNVIFPNLDDAYVNIRNFVRDGQKFGALGMLNTTWDDDGEALFGMTWPPLVLGAACSWQQGECSLQEFQKSYDWAFYRNQDATFVEALQNLQRAHALLEKAGLWGAYDDAFWMDPFTETGAQYTSKAMPVANELRLAVENALASIYRNRSKARAHGETLDPLILAALRLDLLGMKIQFADEISRYYWDAYTHLADERRVGDDLEEIISMNARLPDLRDATTRVRGYYADQWKRENRPYWLDNVLVRYDVMAQMWQRKILAIREAQVQYRDQHTLPPPEQLGFFAPTPEKKAN